MARFFDIFKNFIWIMVVLLAFLSVTNFVQDRAGIDDKVMDQPELADTYTSIRGGSKEMQKSSQKQEALFSTENPTSGFGSILMFSIVSGGRVFKGMIMQMFNIFIKLPMRYLGLDPVIVSMIATLLIVAIILGLWAIYKLGG